MEGDRSQDRDPHFVRACAVEMHLDHLDISHEPLYAEIYRQNAACKSERSTLMKHWPLHLSEPLSVDNLFEE